MLLLQKSLSRKQAFLWETWLASSVHSHSFVCWLKNMNQVRFRDNVKTKTGTENFIVEGKFSHYQEEVVILHTRTPRPRDVV